MTNISHRFPLRTIGLSAAMLVAGGMIGAALSRPHGAMPAMAAAAPQPISTAIQSNADPRQIVTVKGQVTGVYGNSFTLKDGSGQTLIRAGGRSVTLPAIGQTVTVQGMPMDGGLRARYLITPDGKAWAMGGPHGRGHHGRHGDDDRREGRSDDDRGDRDDDGPPPPPAAPQPSAPPVPAR